MTRRAGSLGGIRVADFSQNRAGPVCTMLLGDLGAEVIKIEVPPGGDPIRQFGARVGGEGLDYLTANRNKRSVALNLRSETGPRIARRLVAGADVVVENFRPGVMKKLGLDYEAVRSLNPRVVYCSISGWGQSGPQASRPGYDQVAQGVSGFMSLTGTEESGPLRVGVPIGDLVAGVYATVGVMAALYERGVSGEGQYVHTSLLETLVSLLSLQAERYLLLGETPEPVGNHHPLIVPAGCFPAADGHLNISIGTEAQWRRLCEAMDLPELADDPRFASFEARAQHRREVLAILTARFRERPRDEWLRRLGAADIASGPVYRVHEVFQDPQVLHTEMVQEISHPTIGMLKLVGFPFKLSGTPPTLTRYPPRYGEHTEEVLKELGCTAEEVAAALQEAGLRPSAGVERA
ncbi:MAG TPA: CoA transferase [Candidatus Methylomirabilis sp.]|nr:CoA transferase [Candidatus Methylomirabilis sp.]